jgi:hypothetical protein
VRIATFHDNVYFASTAMQGTAAWEQKRNDESLDSDSHDVDWYAREARALIASGSIGETQLFALDADLHPREVRSLGFSKDISLEANEKYLAVAYRPFGDALRPLKVDLFDANHLTPIATAVVGAADYRSTHGEYHDVLELFGNQLYVAGVPPFTEPPREDPGGKIMPKMPFARVFAMSLPSLEIISTYKSKKNSYLSTTLHSAAGHINLTNWEGHDELTADLKRIRNHKGFDVEAFDPKTGRTFSCHDFDETDSSKYDNSFCRAFWTGLEAAIVANMNGHILFGRWKNRPGKTR